VSSVSDKVTFLTPADRAALHKLDEVIEDIFELPATRLDDLWDKVMPACQVIQNVVITSAQRPGAPA
jgi:hypothetical protein